MVFLSEPVRAQPAKANGPYRVGYQRLQRYDVTRSFDTTRTDSLRFRPVQMELFYPSTQPRTATLPYSSFLEAYGSRMNFGLSADSCRHVGAQLGDYLQASLNLDATRKLRTLPTQSSLKATMAAGPLPLVLYCPSYNGLSYENLLLLEELARRGYLVAAVSSVGKFPGYMTMDPVDVIEQVADAQFARAYLQQRGWVMADQVAVLGYSWGGLAATLLAMQAPVHAVISLDGSDRYAYGADPDEDAQFSRIRQAVYFHPRRLRAPYLYVSSAREATETPVDSVYALPTSSRAFSYIRLLEAQHEDFSCLPTLAQRLDARRPTPVVYPLLQQLVASWLDTHLRHQASFATTLRALLRQYPAQLTLAAPPLVRASAGGATEQVLWGTTTDAHGRPLPYVSIGLVGGNQGTVSRGDGTFDLRLRGVHTTDKVRLSCVGYQRREWSLAELSTLAKAGALRLVLREQQTSLPEVVVRAARPVRRLLGNTTTSKFVNAGFGSAASGAQVGIPLHLGKKQVSLEKVAVQVSYNRYDSLLLRLNVYRLHQGVPTDNLLAEQVLVRVGHQTGAVTFDLTRHPLAATGNVLVAVELVQGWGRSQKGLYLSAGYLNGSSYYRQTSEGAWRRARGMGASIQAEVLLAESPD